MPANASSLPTEILCIIFFHAIERDEAYWESNEHLDWISSISHTCQKWRHVALDWPAFWAESICCSRSNEATDCFLERAKSAPLAFRTPYSRRNKSLTDHQLALAEQLLSRIQVLDSPLPRSFFDTLRERVREQLVYLRAIPWDSVSALHLAFEQTSAVLSAPALRELRFCGTFIAVNAPNLRTLEIENHECGPFLVKTLRAMPLLESLTLRHVSEDAWGVSEDSDSQLIPVDMPYLRHIELESHQDNFLFCRFLRAPNDASIKITHRASNLFRNFPILLTNLDRYHSSSTRDTLIICNPVSKYVRQDNALIIIWRCSELALRCRESKDDPRLWLEFPSDVHNDSTVKTAIRILPDVRRENIRLLDLADMRWHWPGLHKPDVVSMRALLAPFVNVEAVLLSVHQTKRHIVALCQGETIIDWPSEDDEEEDEGTAPASCVLPALRHLVVNELSNPHGKRLSVKILEGSWRAIIHVLKERRRAGCPIRQLTLADTYRFPKPRRGDDSREALEACDNAYLLRARKLAGKMVDARGAREWSVLEYDQRMQGLLE